MTTKKTTSAKKSAANKSAAKKPERAPKSTKKAVGANGEAQAKTRKVSALGAAATLLAGSKEPMGCKEMIEAMAAKGLWTSPGGQTPHATLFAAIIREIKVKGKDSRFKKTDRGQFAANG